MRDIDKIESLYTKILIVRLPGDIELLARQGLGNAIRPNETVKLRAQSLEDLKNGVKI